MSFSSKTASRLHRFLAAAVLLASSGIAAEAAPIRVGKNELHAMLQRWIPRLDLGADGWLVVQRNLGSDSLQRWLQAEFPSDYAFLRHATSKGYRVLRVRRR